jgi:RNA polymerase sigma factor (sigma-70 family)
MADAPVGSVLRHLRGLAGGASVAAASDRELLERFCARRDEAAFAQLLRRHGPMVLHVGRRVLGPAPDAEDVFQATFLLLARKAGSIRKRQSVGSWLHGVAHHLALQARTREARRQAHERRAASMREATPAAGAAWRELQEVLDQALAEVPEKYRAALVLCCLGGQTQEQAARQLGCPVGTVGSRLARGRALLRARLARRGLALSAAALATALAANGATAALPAGLLKSTLAAGARFAAGDRAAGLVSAEAAALADGGLKTMFASKAKAVMALMLALGFLVGGVVALARPVAPDPPPAADTAEQPRSKAPPAADAADPLPEGALARLGTVRFRHGRTVTAISFSPDGKRLVSGDMDGTLRLWEVPSGRKLLQAERRDGGASYVAFSPDGKMVAAAGLDHVVYVWDAATWKVKLYELKAPGEFFFSVGFSADSKALAAGTSGGTVYLWDLTTGQETGRLKGHQGTVRCAVFSPDGKALATGGDDKTARLWDVAAAKELHQLKGNAGTRGVTAIAFDRDGKTVVTGAGGDDEPMRVWDVGTGKELRQIKGGHRNGVRHLTFSPDGKSLTSAGLFSLRLWDWATGKELRPYWIAPEGSLLMGGPIALTADGKTLAAAQSEGIRLWAVDSGKELLPAAGHGAGVHAATFSPDGRTLASGGEDGTILWDGPTGKERRRLPGPVMRSSALTFSPDGKLLAAGCSDRVRLWDPATGKEAREALKVPEGVGAVAFSADGKLLACGGWNRTVRVWELATGKELRRIEEGPGQFALVALSPDGTLLAWGAEDGLIRLWDVGTGKELRRLEGHESQAARGAGGVGALAFSPDGKTLASGGGDRTVRLWDVTQGKELARLDGHRSRVASVAFSPNGRMLASVGWDLTVRLWEVATHQERRRFEGHQGWVQGVAFSADGQTVASASQDTTVLLWDAISRPPKDRAAAKLTAEELKALWADLASRDAQQAYAAIGRLVAAPAQAVPVLESGLRPVPAADPKVVARLVADLGSDEFDKRDKAAKELERMGDAAEPHLRQALADKPASEVRRAIDLLLTGLEGRAERVRAVRALEVLEYVATPEAKKLLAELAKGAPGAWLTEEAKPALDRLTRRPSP